MEDDETCQAMFVEFLHYVEASGSSEPPDSNSPRIQKIYERIKRVRANEQLGVEYMQALQLLKDGVSDADILKLADCDQALLDEVRKALATS